MKNTEKIKERETGKENPPPAPPLREKGKEKESHGDIVTPARARVELPPFLDVRTPPSLELLLAFAHERCGFYDDEFTCEWFRMMNDEFLWCHPGNGRPIRHWPAYFRIWRANRKFFERLRDPERIPDARKCGTMASADPRAIRVKHADNWRGTRKEDIDDVLG